MSPMMEGESLVDESRRRDPTLRILIEVCLFGVALLFLLFIRDTGPERPFHQGPFFTGHEHYVEPTFVQNSSLCEPCNGAPIYYGLRYRHRATFVYSYFLGNNTWRTLTVTNIHLSGCGGRKPCRSLLVEQLEVRRKGWEGKPSAFRLSSPRRFAPFTLRRRERRLLVYRARFDNCESNPPRDRQDSTGTVVTWTRGTQQHSLYIDWPLVPSVELNKERDCPGF